MLLDGQQVCRILVSQIRFILLIDSNNNSERSPITFTVTSLSVRTASVSKLNHTFFNHGSAFQLGRVSAQPQPTWRCECQVTDFAPVPRQWHFGEAFVLLEALGVGIEAAQGAWPQRPRPGEVSGGMAPARAGPCAAPGGLASEIDCCISRSRCFHQWKYKKLGSKMIQLLAQEPSNRLIPQLGAALLQELTPRRWKKMTSASHLFWERFS